MEDLLKASQERDICLAVASLVAASLNAIGNLGDTKHEIQSQRKSSLTWATLTRVSGFVEWAPLHRWSREPVLGLTRGPLA